MRFSLKTLQKDLRMVTDKKSVRRRTRFGWWFNKNTPPPPPNVKNPQRDALENKMKHNLDMYMSARNFNNNYIKNVTDDLKKTTNPEIRTHLYAELNAIAVKNIKLGSEYNIELEKNKKLLATLNK